MFKCLHEKKALLIGNTYVGTRNRELPSCSKDIERIKSLLINKLNFQDKNIISKSDAFPEKELNIFLKNIEDDDLVFIYFAGHGGELVGSVNVPKNIGLMSSWINPDNTYFLSYNLDNILSKIKTKCKILLFSDTCYAGKFLDYYTGKNEIYFIGASGVANKTGNYGKDKTGALVLLLEYLLYKDKDIIYKEIREKSELFRKKERFLKYISLKVKNE